MLSESQLVKGGLGLLHYIYKCNIICEQTFCYSTNDSICENLSMMLLYIIQFDDGTFIYCRMRFYLLVL